MRQGSALVFGKFYPPHPGHVSLIEDALRLRATAAVICLGSIRDSFSPHDRLTALLEDAAATGVDLQRVSSVSGYDEAPFDTGSDAVWRSHVLVLEAHLAQLPFRPDLVVTPEPYGPELARRLGMSHAGESSGVRRGDVSSTMVRADPMAHWGILGPGTRSLLCSRVVVIGAESTGTTTVAHGLAGSLSRRGGPWAETQLVTEYGRELTEQKQLQAERELGSRPLAVEWTTQDFEDVVAVQDRREEVAARISGPVVVCDTDSFATAIWERRYVGDGARLDGAALGRGDVYLVTHDEGVPFVQDGMRDGEHVRREMTEWFLETLVAHTRPFAVLAGTLEERLALAERITDQVVRQKLSFAQPI